MDTRHTAFATPLDDHRGARRHRYMESADINAAFREVFRPLRTNIRRGMTLESQLYALEMDGIIPGQLLGTDWIPPASRGIDDVAHLSDEYFRHAVFKQLLTEDRPEALFAYVTECTDDHGHSTLYVEIASEDACYAAIYPVKPGSGWHRRELGEAVHHRLARPPRRK